MVDKIKGKKADILEDKMTGKMVATLELPADVVQVSPGFSLDIGDTIAKLVYRDKSDFINSEPRNKDQVKSGKVAVKMVSFPSGETDAIVDYINIHCDVTPCEHGGHYVFFTSIIEDKGREIREKLNFPTMFLNKIGCYVAGMCYLVKHMSQEEAFDLEAQEGICHGDGLLSIYRGFRFTVESEGLGSLPIKEKPETPNITCHFPVILTICDSEFDYIRVEEDGQFCLLDSCSFGGQAFLALTKYMTGLTDPNEINSYVERSSGQTVDAFADEFIKSDLDDDPYSQMKLKTRLFPFGKSPMKFEDVEPGDIVHSLLQTICELGAQVGSQVCQTQGIQLNYFCGGLMGTAKARHFTTGMMHFCQHMMEDQVDYQILKNGDFLAAIGAFIEPYIQQHK